MRSQLKRVNICISFRISVYCTIFFNKSQLKYTLFSSTNIQTEEKLCSQLLGPFKEPFMSIFSLSLLYRTITDELLILRAHLSCRYAIPTLVAFTFIRAVYFRIYVNIHMCILPFERDVLHLHIRIHTLRMSH